MIEVSVADAIYCSMGICQPLDWWSSAAAWAQAVLTAGTFAGTVVYQAKESSARERREATHKASETNDRRRRDLAMARVFAARELRRWRRALRTQIKTNFESPEDEVAHGFETLRQMTWSRDPQELLLLGSFGEELVDLIALADDVADALEHDETSANKGGSATTLEDVRKLWTRLEAGITRLLNAMETAQKRLA
ncbi:TPA: hypothetical protein UMY79_004361 [Stenotrophomonas maltophilia]|nr:hypothetical protein [Stenotrophomonas maltophilia]HEL3817427.1 hypothetical protein [Stenotrophomonas maltophilia]